MDPVSLAASIITVIGATSVTGTALERLWSLRRPPDYLAAAINEVTDLRATLRLVHAAIASAGASLSDEVQTDIQGLLHRAKEKLEDLDRYVHVRLMRSNSTSSDDSPTLRRRAILGEILGNNQRKLDVLRLELSSIRIGLSVALGAVNTIQHNQMSRLFMSINQISFVQAPGSQVQDRSASTTAANTGNFLSHGAQQFTLQNSQLESFLCNDSNSSSAFTEPGSPGPTHLRITTKVRGGTCKAHCPCQCHIPLQGSTPRWLRGLVGSLFFHFTGTPLLNYRSCDLSVCGNKEEKFGSAYFQYYFPKWLLTKGIMIRGEWHNLGGIGATWSFKIPRSVTSLTLNEELLSVGRYKPVVDIRKFMALNRITAVDVDIAGESMFELAVNFWREDMCLLLLELGADMNYQTQQGVSLKRYFWKQALRFPTAYRRNLFGNLQSLPELEDELEAMDLVSLHRIVLGLSQHDLSSQIELEPSLVHARDCFGFTPLHWAAQRDDLDAINILLNAGADINSLCNQGRTPLSWAVWCGSLHCCKTLLDPGALVKATKPTGSNAMAGLQRGPAKTDTIYLLLQRGADANIKEPDCAQTCLMGSTVLGTAAVCETLLDHGADMELVNSSFGTPAVFHAVFNNNPDVLRVLIRRGACLTTITKQGHSIVDYAALYGGVEVMKILAQAGIKGLHLRKEEVEKSWQHFQNERDSHFSQGRRESIDVETAAFQALLDSLKIVDTPQCPFWERLYDLPGSFPSWQKSRIDSRQTPCIADIGQWRAFEGIEKEIELHDVDSRVADNVEELSGHFALLQDGDDGTLMRFHDMPGTFPSLQENGEPAA